MKRIQNSEKESKARQFGAFEGDLSFDAAHDELDATIHAIAQRNDNLVNDPGFCSVNVPSVRANIVILTLLITSFNGGTSHIPKARFDLWRKMIGAAFEDPKLWGYQTWPEDEKRAWKRACDADLKQLRKVLAEAWNE